MSTGEFAPIKITASDESKVRHASGSKLRYVIPFTLSQNPPHDWEDVFDDVWRSFRKQSSGRKAQAYVRKGQLVIECALSDLKVHFENLRSSVDAANEKYQQQLKQRAEKDARKTRKREAKQLVERNAIREALAELDFSLGRER
jgi:hypothetical protein